MQSNFFPLTKGNPSLPLGKSPERAHSFAQLSFAMERNSKILGVFLFLFSSYGFLAFEPGRLCRHPSIVVAAAAQRGRTDTLLTQLQCWKVRSISSFGSGPAIASVKAEMANMRRSGKATGVLTLLWCAAFYSCPSSFARTALQQSNSAAQSGKRAEKTIVYKNKKYRFRFVLPESWKGYSILVSQWTGSVWDPEKREKPIREETGPVITIRHPLWAESNPHQDIPIMILTYAQTDLSKEGNLSTSAAPYGPQEIARNSKYVFALPPRYNYAIATGVEEVAQLFREHSLRPF